METNIICIIIIRRVRLTQRVFRLLAIVKGRLRGEGYVLNWRTPLANLNKHGRLNNELQGSVALRSFGLLRRSCKPHIAWEELGIDLGRKTHGHSVVLG